MKSFTTLKSNLCPLDIANVDTDQIIPKQFLKRIERIGFGQFLFWDWRFLKNGKQENENFVLNKKEYRNSKILLSRDNFGCGSSREHAPWALFDYGFSCIIAPSFADIFYNNCFQNGILPIVLVENEINKLFKLSFNNPNKMINIFLEEQVLDCGNFSIPFSISPKKKKKLLEGLDDIDITLEHEEEIEIYENNHIFPINT